MKQEDRWYIFALFSQLKIKRNPRRYTHAYRKNSKGWKRILTLENENNLRCECRCQRKETIRASVTFLRESFREKRRVEGREEQKNEEEKRVGGGFDKTAESGRRCNASWYSDTSTRTGSVNFARQPCTSPAALLHADPTWSSAVRRSGSSEGAIDARYRRRCCTPRSGCSYHGDHLLTHCYRELERQRKRDRERKRGPSSVDTQKPHRLLSLSLSLGESVPHRGRQGT